MSPTTRLATLALLGGLAAVCGSVSTREFFPKAGTVPDPLAGEDGERAVREDADGAQLFAAAALGPLCGAAVAVGSHLFDLGFAGWTWRFLLLAVVAGAAACWFGAHLACADVRWARRVQRGSLGLKRMGHRKTLYGVSALWWMSRLFSNLVAAAQAGAAGLRSRVDAYEPGWFAPGVATDLRDAAREATETADLTLGLIQTWDAVCGSLAAVGVLWSFYWLRHDALVREAETGARGTMSREVCVWAVVNVAVWLGLQALWPT
ncbi:hypothetical protein [Alienimonas sp. DA493]|uniref:hypothetical protein n=1 Tax=Alienimonas sp. DA493 TaxID=3373605 RepID=UPI003754B40E